MNGTQLIILATGCEQQHYDTAYAVLMKIGDLRSALKLKEQAEQVLNGRSRCNGNEHFNSKGMMYMHHADGSECPVHGRQKEGSARGLRKYIGAKADKQQEARLLFDTHRQWQKAKQAEDTARRELETIERRLNQVIATQTRMW